MNLQLLICEFHGRIFLGRIVGCEPWNDTPGEMFVKEQLLLEMDGFSQGGISETPPITDRIPVYPEG
jgi:hypothetical protein